MAPLKRTWLAAGTWLRGWNPGPDMGGLKFISSVTATKNGGCAAMVLSKRFVLLRHFQGEPQLSDFQLESEDLPPPIDGEVLAQAEFISVDPYMRVYTMRQPPGGTMIGTQVARVLESKCPEWKVGDRLVADLGWRTHSVFKPTEVAKKSFIPMFKLPELGTLPPSLGLGILGMPGNTAYLGFLEICRPKEGETVVVSGAAGAVGSTVGQIAKIKGCRTVGFAGSDAKVKWLIEKLGFDAAFNYKTKDIADALKEGAPEGVDCYFDNVGGELSSTVIHHMKLRGRVAVCGTISSNNADPKNHPKATVIQRPMITNQIKMEGFTVTQWRDRWMEGIEQNLQWIREEKLKFRETITSGFENTPSAFIGLLKGENIGKAIVKV